MVKQEIKKQKSDKAEEVQSDTVTKSDSIDRLIGIAKEHGVIPGIQMAISGYVTEVYEPFSELTEDLAKEVLDEIDHSGFNQVQKIALEDQQPEESFTKNETTDVVSEKVKQLGSVYDSETKEFVQIDAETRALAQALQQRVDMATLMTAMILKRMSDEKLYLGLGYSNFKEYVLETLPFGESSAKKYLKIGRKFAGVLPEDFGKGEPVHLLEENENAQKLSGLGVKKLYDLTKIEDADFSEVVSQGVVKLNDGTELDLDEINASTAKEFKAQLDAHREYQADLEKELDKTAEERDEALQKADQATKDSETGKKYKDLYGPKSKEYEAYKSRIAVARNRALDLNQALSQITDLPPDEYEALCDELRDLHKLIDRGLKALREDNLGVFPAGGGQ